MKKLLPFLLLLGVVVWAATPNMGLNKPYEGDQNYVSKINTDLDLIDAHDHTSGKGALITSAAIADKTITSGDIADEGVTTLQIEDGTIVGDDIASNGIDRDNLPVVGEQQSIAISATSTSTTLVDVSLLTVTATKDSRPALILLESSGTDNATYGNGGYALVSAGEIALLKNGTIVQRCQLKGGDTSRCLMTWLDTGGAGTNVYKIQFRSPAGDTVGIASSKLTFLPL